MSGKALETAASPNAQKRRREPNSSPNISVKKRLLNTPNVGGGSLRSPNLDLRSPGGSVEMDKAVRADVRKGNTNIVYQVSMGIGQKGRVNVQATNANSATQQCDSLFKIH